MSWEGHDAGLAPVAELFPTGLVEPAHCSMPLKSAWPTNRPAAKSYTFFGEAHARDQDPSHDDGPGLASNCEFQFTYSSAPSFSTSLGTSPQSSSIQSSLVPTSTSSESNSPPATSMSTSTSTSNYGNVPCRSCSKIFCDTSTRNRHEKLHRPKYFDIACSSCGETFGRNDACLKHIRNLHAGATESVHPVKISKLP